MFFFFGNCILYVKHYNNFLPPMDLQSQWEDTTDTKEMDISQKWYISRWEKHGGKKLWLTEISWALIIWEKKDFIKWGSKYNHI